MTAEQHSSDEDLLGFAAGRLIDRERDAVARHVSECERCREFVQAMEHVGGLLLEGLPPAPMSSGSLSEMIARIDQPDLTRSATPGSFSVFRPSSSGRRWFGGERMWPQRRRLLQALPIAAAIALSVGVTYFLIGNPVSPPVSLPSGLKIVWTRRAVGEGVKFCPRAGCGRSACPVRFHITGEYQHPIPVDTLQIEQRPGYVATPNDETRPLAYERQVVFFHTNEPPGTLLGPVFS